MFVKKTVSAVRNFGTEQQSFTATSYSLFGFDFGILNKFLRAWENKVDNRHKFLVEFYAEQQKREKDLIGDQPEQRDEQPDQEQSN